MGTPAFTPPETVHRSALDGRSDLFSLGATLYFALTGRTPFQARTFADVLVAWNTPPPAPSVFKPELPPGLDDLVLSLLSSEPALRPRSAFEVMQRLAAIAGLARDESADVSRAYLATPALVGRDRELSRVRERISRSIEGRGASLLLRGAPGIGRSRVLDACVLEAKTLGATVLRATASLAQEPFGVAIWRGTCSKRFRPRGCASTRATWARLRKRTTTTTARTRARCWPHWQRKPRIRRSCNAASAS
jgi:hypothetical protein